MKRMMYMFRICMCILIYVFTIGNISATCEYKKPLKKSPGLSFRTARFAAEESVSSRQTRNRFLGRSALGMTGLGFFSGFYKLFESDMRNKDIEHKIIDSVLRYADENNLSCEQSHFPLQIIVRDKHNSADVFIARLKVDYILTPLGPIIFQGYLFCVDKNSFTVFALEGGTVKTAHYASNVTSEVWGKTLVMLSSVVTTLDNYNNVKIEISNMEFHPNVIRVEFIPEYVINIRCKRSEGCNNPAQSTQKATIGQANSDFPSTPTIGKTFQKIIDETRGVTVPSSFIIFVDQNTFEIIGRQPAVVMPKTTPISE